MYLLDKHTYAPELNKLYIIKNGQKIKIETKDHQKHKMGALSNQSSIKKFVRNEIFKPDNGYKKLELRLINSCKKFDDKIIGFNQPMGKYDNLLNFIKEYRKNNNGYHDIINSTKTLEDRLKGLIEDDDYSYDRVYNQVTVELRHIH